MKINILIPIVLGLSFCTPKPDTLSNQPVIEIGGSSQDCSTCVAACQDIMQKITLKTDGYDIRIRVVNLKKEAYQGKWQWLNGMTTEEGPVIHKHHVKTPWIAVYDDENILALFIAPDGGQDHEQASDLLLSKFWHTYKFGSS